MKMELNAREKFKLQINTAIAKAREYYSEGDKEKFYNAVVMLDVLLTSYKHDTVFQENFDELSRRYQISEAYYSSLASITRDKKYKDILKNHEEDFYIEWFRMLVDLAVRTIFQDKDVDVDIDMTEVFAVVNKIKGEKK